jgi:hypothetical protein
MLALEGEILAYFELFDFSLLLNRPAGYNAGLSLTADKFEGAYGFRPFDRNVCLGYDSMLHLTLGVMSALSVGHDLDEPDKLR